MATRTLEAIDTPQITEPVATSEQSKPKPSSYSVLQENLEAMAKLRENQTNQHSIPANGEAQKTH